MLPENSSERLSFAPGTTFHLGPNLDSDFLTLIQPVQGRKVEVKNGWQTIEVVARPGEKPVILYQATPEPKPPQSV